MKNLLFWLLSLLPAAGQPLAAQDSVTVVQPAAVSLHEGWNALLQKHVSENGVVDYKGFKADKADLDAYLEALSENVPTKDTPRDEALAYWINAYNAFTVDLITRNYPTKSILRFDNGKTWDVKRIKLGGEKYSLNQIENEIIRPQFKEPRIHFAVNCAAQSCPPLANEAFTASNLEQLLDARARAFINNKKYNAISAKSVQLSKIFDWYGKDFGNLVSFLNQYSTVKISAKATIGFKEYDWDLNE